MILGNIIRRLFGFKPGLNINSIVYGPPLGPYEDDEDLEDDEYSDDESDAEEHDRTNNKRK